MWSSGVVLSGAYELPSPPEVFGFLGGAVGGGSGRGPWEGAVVAFAVVGALAFGGVTAEFGGGLDRVELWGPFHFLSVGLAVAATCLASSFALGFVGWPLGAFAATGTHLVVGLEQTAADRRTGGGG